LPYSVVRCTRQIESFRGATVPALRPIKHVHFENRALRRIFGPKKEKVAGGWRTQHNAEFHNLCASTHIIRVIKSRKMRWAGHIARMKEIRNAYKILV